MIWTPGIHNVPEPPKFPHIENIVDLVQEWLNKVSQLFLKRMEYSGLRRSDLPMLKEITTLFPKEARDADLRPLLRKLRPLLTSHQYQD